MRVPVNDSLAEVQECFRAIWRVIARYDVGSAGNPDLHGTRYTNVGRARNGDEYVTLAQMQEENNELRAQVDSLAARLRALGG